MRTVLKGYEDLSPEEMRAKERELVATRLIEAIVDRIQKDPSFEYIFNDRSLSPAEVYDILENLGWEQTMFEDNGWEQDTWYVFSHPDQPQEIRLFYSGFYWNMCLGSNT